MIEYKYQHETAKMIPFLFVDQLKKSSFIAWVSAGEEKKISGKQMLYFKLPYWYSETHIISWLARNEQLLDSIPDVPNDQWRQIELEISASFVH